MKKLLIVALFCAVVGFVSNASADNYVVALTSYTVDAPTTTFAATYPTIEGGVLIDKLVISTTDTITAPLLIGIYDTATSTALATVDAYYVLIGTTTTSDIGQTLQVDYPYYNALKLSNPGFFKADGDATKKVWVDIQYR
jgi:hypothetical protein